MKALCAEADRLQQSHPINASQIQVKREELIANWEQIRTLAAERHARLNDSYRWVTAAGQWCFPPCSHLTEGSWKEKKGVLLPKFWDDSGVFGAVLFTKFYFTLTSCSKRNIYMIEKLLQLFVIRWVWINYESRHSDVSGHLLFSLSWCVHFEVHYLTMFQFC